MLNARSFAAAVLLAATLAGCGQTASPLAARAGGNVAAAAAKQDPATKADADRPEPPAAGKVSQPKQGLAARKAGRVAEDALYNYSLQFRDWERAWTNSEKDRIESKMLSTLHAALQDVQQVTSDLGNDTADRRAYDIADRGLDRYTSLYSSWERSWSEREKREILNDMLTVMVQSLKDVKANY